MSKKRMKKTIMSLLFSFAFIGNSANASIPEAPKVEAKSYVLMEYKTGKILNELEADKKLAPASLTKIMTAFVVFDELQSGRLHMEDKVKISKKAWKTDGSRTFVQEGTSVAVEDLIKGTIVQSGNDAATALAEHISGSTSEFANLMNFHARKIGMTNSHFKNPTGLPERGHYTTARDLANLTKAMIDKFPEYYYIYQMKKFTYGDIPQNNRNKLLREDLGFDGLKTGYTRNAGYCYVGASLRGDTRMIVTLLNEPSPKQRFEDAKKLVNYGFRFYETHKIINKEEAITELTTRVLKGDIDFTKVGAKEDLVVVLKRDEVEKIKYKAGVYEKITAPLPVGSKVGDIEVFLEGKSLGKIDLITLDNIEEGGFFKRAKDTVLEYF
tara:strand:- start:34931 stop:36079 length:1149 start_codon:yes stop_codon:yes gene_type:complete